MEAQAVEPAVHTPHRMKKAYSRVSGLRRAGASTRALPPLEDGAERGQPGAQLQLHGQPGAQLHPELERSTTPAGRRLATRMKL